MASSCEYVAFIGQKVMAGAGPRVAVTGNAPAIVNNR
jgi:hypothetical protein